MNSVSSFSERQYGKKSWTNYDSVLRRFGVDAKDSWSGILPSTEGADYNPEPPILAAKFAVAKGFEHILAIANEDGMVAFHDTTFSAESDSIASTPLEGHQWHHNAVFDLAWMPFHTQIVSASGDHTARLWDLVESRPTPCRIFSGHSRSLKTVCFRPEDPAVFATGGRDGAIFIWDVRAASAAGGLQVRPDDSISSCHGSASSTPGQVRRRHRGGQTPGSGGLTANLPRPHSITGLVFRDSYDLISCGAGDGMIKIWDLRKTYGNAKREPLPRNSLYYAGSSACKGFTNLTLDYSRTRLYANCMDNRIYCYNSSGGQSKPLNVYSGLENATFYIKSALSPDGRYLISGSSDERAYIWNVEWPTPLAALEGHAAEVTCVAWCQQGEPKVVTCSDDAKHKVWRIMGEDADDTMIRGRNKPVPGYANGGRDAHSLEYTPRSVKRWVGRSEKTPSTGSNLKSRQLCDRCETMTPLNASAAAAAAGKTTATSCVKCQMMRAQSSSRCSKRTSSDMLGTPDMDAADGQASSAAKRFHTENKGARRLFVHQPSTSTELSAIREEPDGPTEPGCSTPMTPISERKCETTLITTPQTSRILAFSSPTVNLPNYVLDGEAPHLRNVSPKKKFKENVDWLTKHRKQKRLYEDFAAGGDLQEPHSPKVQREGSPKTHGTPARRTSRSRSSADNILKTPKQSSAGETTLLKFFTVTRNKQCLKND